MTNFLNITTHFLLGVWIGRTVNHQQYRFGAIVTTISFLFYQLLGVMSKGDRGYPEVKEFMLGTSAALASNRVEALIESKPLKAAAAVGVIAIGAGVCYLIVRSRDDH